MKRASGMDASAVALRQEVNFCCPIPSCRNTILTYHHFDPPWSVKNHNDVAGMIALCPVCHGKADGKAWTNAELRYFKQHPKSPAIIREQFGFPEPGKRVLYRLGGNYVFSTNQVLQLAGIPILVENRSSSGIHSFSFQLLDHRNQLMLVVHENSVSVDALETWDCFFNSHGNHLVFKKREGTIALDLRVRRRTLEDLLGSYGEDCNRALKHVPTHVDALFKRPTSSVPPLPDEIVNDVKSECVDSDGLICVIDIARANLHANGRKLVVRNGIQAGGTFAANFAGKNSGVAFSLPGLPVLHKHYQEMITDFSVQDAMIVQREELLSEMGQLASPKAKDIYDDAVKRFPAMMAVASGMQAFRIAQGNPNFTL